MEGRIALPRRWRGGPPPVVWCLGGDAVTFEAVVTQPRGRELACSGDIHTWVWMKLYVNRPVDKADSGRGVVGGGS